MAQAARLSLRMHKELKLLLSDPPHGASFPHLSSGDFSTIDALIEGPEDTVYAHGIFDVKIQIPERYPFQPPIVAFATPIYHPNIDTSGRICLDILNLPPKGAWQPSLNISTVLMSIRLLLSEPNPDDGLMCEVSREYKYNRQTFDFKAREMTDKYAKVKSDGSSTSLHIHKSPNRCEVKSHGDERGNSVIAGNHEKLKLTVESSLTITPTESRETLAKDMPNRQLLLSNTGDGNGKRKEMSGFCEANTSVNKSSRKKLSLALPPKSQKEDLCGEEFTGGVSAVCKENKKPHLNGKKLSLGLKKPVDNATSLTNNLASSLQTSAAKSDNNRLSRKLSLKPFGESELNEVSKNKGLAKTDMEPEMNQNQDARSWWGVFENSGMEEAVVPGPFVVLDSDESGEDEERETRICRSSRSRSSLTRRGLKRKP